MIEHMVKFKWRGQAFLWGDPVGRHLVFPEKLEKTKNEKVETRPLFLYGNSQQNFSHRLNMGKKVKKY